MSRPKNHAPGDGRSYRLAFEDADFLWRDEMRAMRLAAEFAKPDLMMGDRRIRSTVVFFGSARCAPREDDPDPRATRTGCIARLDAALYEQARLFARRVGEYGVQLYEACDGAHRDYVVTTGGGPGLMEAANRGAAEAGAPTIGLNIELPHEQEPNAFVTEGLSFKFQYFALRKMHFLLRARALAIFPGGFGTLDELFDTLTLIQTGKMPAIPILMFGRDYWQRVIDFDAMVAAGTIDPADRDLIHWVEDPEAAWRLLVAQGGSDRPAWPGGEAP